jgi:hypothetical protein
MTTFYGLPNSGAFWHWPTLIHFLVVALAGGVALLVAVLCLRQDRAVRRYALLALIFLGFDLFLLWAESPARFRLTHIWLFVGFHPGSAMWWGAWGLSGSAVASALIALGWGPRKLWAALLLVTATVTLIYPGLLLAANSGRPLWTPLLLAFVPVTSLVIVLGGVLLLRWAWVKPWFLAASLSAVLLGGLYLVGLAVGDFEARQALSHFWDQAGWFYLVGLGLMLAAVALLRRFPLLAGLSAFAGAALARSLIVELGQHQPFGF